MGYSIREVDGCDGWVAADLLLLHDLTFGDQAPPIDPEEGFWWLAHPLGKLEPVAFAGVYESPMFPGCGYFHRVGVLPEHRGAGLQLRLMRAMESLARRQGWIGIVSDTTNDNVASANNFIKAGYRQFWPDQRWSFAHSIYWRKKL